MTGVPVPTVTTPAQTMALCLDLLTNFYERLLSVEVVEAIYADWRPGGLEIWLIVYHATEADQEQIYNHERSLMQTFPGLGVDTHFWIAYPKGASGVKTDVNRDRLWEAIEPTGWRAVRQIALDDVWPALRFRPAEKVGK